jgi:hypothetical protein
MQDDVLRNMLYLLRVRYEAGGKWLSLIRVFHTCGAGCCETSGTRISALLSLPTLPVEQKLGSQQRMLLVASWLGR